MYKIVVTLLFLPISVISQTVEEWLELANSAETLELRIEYITKAVESEKENASLLNLRGMAYAEAGENINALRDFNQSISMWPEESIFYFNRGVIHFFNEQLNQALEDFTLASQLDENFPEPHQFMGRSYAVMGDYDKAIKRLDEAIEMDSTYAAAYYFRGFINYDLQNLEAAIVDFQKVKDLVDIYKYPRIKSCIY